jgi:hypothetical protein
MQPNTAPLPAPPEPASTDHRGRIVLLAGSATTLLALAGVFAAAHAGENIMGWYADYIIPAGALLVGAVAASGYGVAAWMTGLKMTRRLIWSVALELFVSYFIAQYGEYQHFFDDGTLVGFFSWFDAGTRAFAWKSSSGAAGEPLGMLGYGLRLLEIAGFVGGGALVPIVLRSKPYCDPCRIYRRTRQYALLPAARESRRIHDDAWQAGLTGVEAIFAAASAGDRARLEQEVAARGPLAQQRSANKLAARIAVRVVRCPRCADGSLVAESFTGHGNGVRRRQIGQVALAPERMRALFDDPS